METLKAIDSFILACKADGLKPRTTETYQLRLQRFSERFVERNIAQITLTDLRAYSADLYTQELSVYTIHGHLRSLRRFYKWLTQEGILEENLALGIRLPRLPDNPPKAITLENFRLLLKTAYETGSEWERRRNVALILVLLDTGCRLHGLAELSIPDIDFELRRAKVIEKNDQWRFVFLNPLVITAVNRWLEIRPTLLADPKDTALWINRNGRKITKSGIQSLLTRLRETAGITGYAGAHSFRHRFAISYLLNGGDLATLANLLGHKDSEVTVKFYARFHIGELQEKHDQFSPVTAVLTASTL